MKPSSSDSTPVRRPNEERPHAREERTPPLIPDHELLRLIGSGSYGSVWLARNSMGVFRAVKIVYRATFSDGRPFERELSGFKKFEPISRSHEGFVDILHVGLDREGEYFFYVMELGDDEISGQNIDPEHYRPKTLGKQIAVHKTLSFIECIELGLALTKALAELHKRLLVHRDVKPTNIIFINGIPKLADIGLVADIHEAGSYVGTTGFIPPEGPGKPQADIYSLGKVLYEASTGKDRQEFPELPTLIETWKERDSFVELNEVILRACQNDPARRYLSAWDLHADLVVLSNGKSIKRLRMLERRVSNVKRIGAFFVASILLSGIIYVKLARERVAIRNARRNADISYGSASIGSGDLVGAVHYFADLIAVDIGDRNRETIDRLRFGSILEQAPKLIHFWPGTNELQGGEFCSDGKTILVTEYYGKAKIYDLQTDRQYLSSFGSEHALVSASYSPDGKSVVTASADGTVCIWNASTLTEQKRIFRPQRAYAARFSPDGKSIVVGYEDGIAIVWNAKTGNQITKFEPGGIIRFVDFSKDGKLIVTGSQDFNARVWDALSGLPVCPPLAHQGWIYAAAFSPDGKSLVTASGDHRARVWNVATGQKVSPDLIHDDAVTSAEFSPDGRLILTASFDGTVRLWSVDDFEPYKNCPILEKGDRVSQATFDKQRPQVLTVCANGNVRIWGIAGYPLRHISNSIFDKNGRRSLFISGPTIEIHDATTGELMSVIDTRERDLQKAIFSSNGKFLLTVAKSALPAFAKSSLQAWVTDSGKSLAHPILVPGIATGASLSDDGKEVILFENRKVSLWDVTMRTQICALPDHSSQIRDAFFSPNGKQVVTINDTQVNVWSAGDGKRLFPSLTHSESVTHAEFSADGTKIISCCADPSFNSCYAQMWSADTGKELGPQLRHRDGVLFATLSPDGKFAATAGEDFVAMIWNVSDGSQIATLRHDEKVTHVAFSHDGKMIITASADHSARVWETENGAPVAAPLIQGSALSDAQFLANNMEIVTSDYSGKCHKWSLITNAMPLKLIQTLAGALNENRTTSLATFSPISTWPFTNGWDRLRNEYPLFFQESSSNFEAWSEMQAEESERANQWFAAAFHLQKLSSYRPDDPNIILRLELANKHVRATP